MWVVLILLSMFRISRKRKVNCGSICELFSFWSMLRIPWTGNIKCGSICELFSFWSMIRIPGKCNINCGSKFKLFSFYPYWKYLEKVMSTGINMWGGYMTRSNIAWVKKIYSKNVFEVTRVFLEWFHCQFT